MNKLPDLGENGATRGIAEEALTAEMRSELHRRSLIQAEITAEEARLTWLMAEAALVRLRAEVRGS